MAKKSKKQNNQGNLIAENRKARFDYFIEETIEAGLVLQGWEIKSLRAGKAQITESYVLLKDNEAWIFGSHIHPLISASTHDKHDPMRTRKLLLHRREIDRLMGQVDQKGYTVVVLKLYWSKGRVKAEIGLAKGKKLHDKRETIKQRDWERNKHRILKDNR